MVVISGGLYAAVRYMPSFNKDRPFQIVATNHDGDGTYLTELNRYEAADLQRSLLTLLSTEANKDG